MARSGFTAPQACCGVIVCGSRTLQVRLAAAQRLQSCEQEKTELEEQRVALVGEVQSYRKKIKQLEDDLLFRLSNSQAQPSPRHSLRPYGSHTMHPCLKS